MDMGNFDTYKILKKYLRNYFRIHLKQKHNSTFFKVLN